MSGSSVARAVIWLESEGALHLGISGRGKRRNAPSYNLIMGKRRIGQLVILLLLTVFLLAPVYEHFDHWDGFPRSGDDTVLSLVAIVTFCGVVLIAARSFFRIFLQRRWVKLERWKPPLVPFVLHARRGADESPRSLFRLSLRV